MASQPIISFSEPVYRQPKPKVSFAVIAGEGAQAVDSAVKALPAATQGATLDDLAWRGMADHLIATAEKLLSPRMYAAFLRWGEAATHLSTRYETDEEGNARCIASGIGVRGVADAPASNFHDLALKSYLLCLEEADAPAFGPYQGTEEPTRNLIDRLSHGIASDLPWQSPLIAMIDELAQRAWSSSIIDQLAIDPAIGSQITAAFSHARGVNSAARGVALSADLPAAGYNPFMRGPLIRWERAYDDWLAARDVAQRYAHEVYDPAEAKFIEVRARWPLNRNVSSDPEIRAALAAVDYSDIDAQDAEYGRRRQTALMTLLTLPAPSAHELAIKLDLIAREEAYEDHGYEDVQQQLIFDARRFARHGAHLQTDADMLSAYAGLRAQMDGYLNNDAWVDSHFELFEAEAPRLADAVGSGRATTIEGVIAKLRVVFHNKVENLASSHAVVDPRHPQFAACLAEASPSDRVLWTAIEDLARIAGVNLSEQGA
jgi:hypothetical protein